MHNGFMQAFISEHLTELTALCRQYHVRRLELFGSAAREDFDPSRSDVDFLLEFEPGQGSWNLQFELQGKLEALYGRKVDLVAGEIRNPYIRKTIDEDRQIVYAA